MSSNFALIFFKTKIQIPKSFEDDAFLKIRKKQDKVQKTQEIVESCTTK